MAGAGRCLIPLSEHIETFYKELPVLSIVIMSSVEIPVNIAIEKEPIRLGQFLKLANVVQDGLEAKMVIQQGEVSVNGILEKRRGRKLVHGDQVSLKSRLYLIQVKELME